MGKGWDHFCRQQLSDKSKPLSCSKEKDRPSHKGELHVQSFYKDDPKRFYRIRRGRRIVPGGDVQILCAQSLESKEKKRIIVLIFNL